MARRPLVLRASDLDSASAGFEILPFVNPCAELLSLDDDHLEVVYPLDLSVATARVVLLALNQISPAFLDGGSRFCDSVLDRPS